LDWVGRSGASAASAGRVAYTFLQGGRRRRAARAGHFEGVDMNRPVRVGTFVALLLMGAGCQKTYYAAWEKLGYEKRDILVSRVTNARDDQQAAKEQIKTTLEQFQAVTNFKGGDLEAKYKKLDSAYQKAEARAADVRSRIGKVELTASAMFSEWTEELGQYKDPKLRAASQQQLDQTRSRYNELIGVMKQAAGKMDPVLATFKDHVLFLKHNLNAQAIASLQGTAGQIDTDVTALIRDMEASINEANEFISEMSKKG
jgi:Skp family chaperone for outer membrane proteins